MIEDALKTDTQNAFNTQRVKQRVLYSQNSYSETSAVNRESKQTSK